MWAATEHKLKETGMQIRVFLAAMALLTTTAVFADYDAAGNTATQLQFNYTVQAGDIDIDGIAVATAIDLNGATLQDAAGNNADVTLGALTTSGVLVDAVAPTISSVAAPTDGTYVAGQTLQFTVNTTELVHVSGTPIVPSGSMMPHIDNCETASSANNRVTNG